MEDVQSYKDAAKSLGNVDTKYIGQLVRDGKLEKAPTPRGLKFRQGESRAFVTAASVEAYNKRVREGEEVVPEVARYIGFEHAFAASTPERTQNADGVDLWGPLRGAVDRAIKDGTVRQQIEEICRQWFSAVAKESSALARSAAMHEDRDYLWYTVDEAARMCGLPPRALHKLISAGKLMCVPHGTKRYVRWLDVKGINGVSDLRDQAAEAD